MPPMCEGGVVVGEGAGVGVVGGAEGLGGAGMAGGTHIVNGSRPSSGYFSRQTSGYTASQDTPPPSAALRVEDREGERQRTPSPTGYRGAVPPPRIPTPEEDDIIHKTILLGDSGVGKTSLLVQFDTGKFQPGTFSATVGIGFTVSVWW
ncbi:hypothetical protein O3P69_011016 [Scylla paramamosain]|uniref:Ras-related protein Rab-26 n=1 Tax=Scylla paramamosain TaxID=85552 RepID=A0AAW0SJX7_SCYPA